MNGFKNTTRMQTFRTGSDVMRTAGQTVGRVQSFSQGGRVFARGGHAKDKIDGMHDVPDVDANHADKDGHGHGLVQRESPQSTQELEEGGGRSPLRSGYAKGGGTKHFHVHKHYHAGGKTNTKSRSYSSAEKAAEREVEGAGPMMATGGTRDRLAKGGKKPFGHIKKGALHKDMGVPAGKKIPKSAIRSKLAHDKASGNTKGVKRDVFALNFGHKHADGGHIHDCTEIPANYPDYATGGTINALSAGGAPYGGMATGGTINPMAAGGMPMSALQGPTGALAARRAALMGRPLPGAIGARPLMRAGGGRATSTEARSAAKAAVQAHVDTPAPRGHKGLARMVQKG